jgi:hypothetical protein
MADEKTEVDKIKDQTIANIHSLYSEFEAKINDLTCNKSEHISLDKIEKCYKELKISVDNEIKGSIYKVMMLKSKHG